MIAFHTAPRASDETLALLYDWEHDEYQPDCDLYVALARRVGGPVLELACGSGRVLEPLAALGLQVVGVDASSAMLARARRRLRAAGRSVELIQRDMTRDVPPGPFALVILALNGLGFVHQLDEQVRLLEHVAARLTPTGVLVLDLVHPATLVDPPSGVPVLQRAGWCDELGADVAKWMVQEVSVSDQQIALTCLYDVAEDDGTLKRLTDRVDLRFFSRFEVELLVEKAGLRIEGIYGGYELEPLEDGCERMIVLAGPRT